MFFWLESLLLCPATVQHPLALLLLLLLSILLLGHAVYWLLACTRLRNAVGPRSLRGRRVLVAVAHPDDECMFFGPTIVSLQRHFGCIVYVLCLSRGAYAGSDGVELADGEDGVGTSQVRWRELLASCRQLGVPCERVLMTSHSQLPDRLDSWWPPELVGRLLLQHVHTLQLHALVTFDRGGVSGHRNHCSVAVALGRLRSRALVPASCQCFQLESVSLLRKYFWCLDMLLVVGQFLVSCMLSRLQCLWRQRVILVAPPDGCVSVAMHEHVTQLVWYRQLYLLFSRYIRINTLVLLSSDEHFSSADLYGSDDSDSDVDHNRAGTRRSLLRRQRPLRSSLDERDGQIVSQWNASVSDYRMSPGSHSP